MHPTSIDEPDTTWKRHFEPLLLCIHCLNAVWIIRIFVMNFENNRNYFFDFYFSFIFILSIVLQIFFWKKFCNYRIDFLINNVDELKKIIHEKIDFLYKAQPYFKYMLIPIESGVDMTDFIFFKNSNKLLNSNKLAIISLFLTEGLISRLFLGFFAGLILYFSTVNNVTGLLSFILSNWIAIAIFHILCLSVILISVFQIIFYYIFIKE